MFKKLFLGVFLVFMVGCASLPETLKTQTETPITDLVTIIDDPDGAQGQEVRLGGIIASITNEKDRTRLEIASLPLTSDGRPRIDSKPVGRFVAYVPGFLEPLEYAPDRLVTVVGRLTGKEDGKVGEHEYAFPVVDATGNQIWRVKQEIRMDEFDSYHSCFGSRCSYFGFGTTRGEVYHRVTK
ncbi:Slp family lipoprotein [Photobacterium sanguinicancri]|uniref:Slp family lipoprotein n=1 Tax=Photobacterium sanguinicancri TaxID=875932 RepID=A0AAW7XXC1_9GAMM|nr:Slp family lipoprotein [Photobacterium sanguinicancri]KXI23153.1 starvation-inducible protein [Photobacterium sanguinicancri]MDO6497421.1 Slp family lipoprotein [Photobacterium sanguinicancri]MDO6540953.1 Slp family lipoprotein [Photobacterium sanguinicancri]OZS43965.1 starvation-inducible protein [Photobacterium sanguinicancri]